MPNDTKYGELCWSKSVFLSSLTIPTDPCCCHPPRALVTRHQLVVVQSATSAPNTSAPMLQGPWGPLISTQVWFFKSIYSGGNFLKVCILEVPRLDGELVIFRPSTNTASSPEDHLLRILSDKVSEDFISKTFKNPLQGFWTFVLKHI